MVIHDIAEKLNKTKEDSTPLSTLKDKKQKLMMNKTREQPGARSECPAGAVAAPTGGPLRFAPSHRLPVPTPRLGHCCRRSCLQQVRLPRPGSQRPSSPHSVPWQSTHSRKAASTARCRPGAGLGAGPCAARMRGPGTSRRLGPWTVAG